MGFTSMVSAIAGAAILCFSYKKLAVIELFGPVFLLSLTLVGILIRTETLLGSMDMDINVR